jgi:N-acetylmuramoyl-L-alanine amidase
MMSMGLAKVAYAGTAYAEGNGTSDEQLLARAINGEARGEPYVGQVAVGCSYTDRTRDSRFPKNDSKELYTTWRFVPQ